MSVDGKKGYFTLKKKKIKIIVICILAAVLLVAAAVVVVLQCLPNNNPESPSNELGLYSADYRTTARQGYSAEYLGSTERNLPSETKDGGLVERGLIPYYPTYGSKADYTVEQKNYVIAEAASLNSSATVNGAGDYYYFDKNGCQRDEDGNYVCGDDGQPKRLYKHTAADSMYYAGKDPLPYLSDDEPAVVKRITFAPRASSLSYGVTGLYAPAGELVKVQVGESDLNAAGGKLTFYIGQCLYNGANNNIWSAKDINRMPTVMNTLVMNAATSEYDAETKTYVCYLGSYLGGPIYLRNTDTTVTVTISGAVEYRHFILGYTTEEEYGRLCNSTAPYFDLEVWDNGVLHSGSVYYAKDFSYGDLFDAAVLWEKISLVSTQVTDYGIAMLYDPFVAAGAAVAFVGKASANCPSNWMTSALDASAFETSGAWGVIHEYNHNFQSKWGLPGGGEVTNNALNLASYAAFTDISSSRTLSASGDGGLSSWNAYANASWALRQVLAGNYGDTSQLSVYAALLHNIGAENFVNAAALKKGNSVDGYYLSLSETTGYDFTYYFKELCNLTPSDSALSMVAQQNKTPFIPVATTYQTGRLVKNSDGSVEYAYTMQPYNISYGTPFTVDLRPYTTENGLYSYGSVVLPEDFDYKIISISSPEHGSIEKTEVDNVYTYIPDDSLNSGKIILTLKISYNGDGSAYTFADQEIKLALEFKQSRESTKNTLERTVYKYAENNMYKDPAEAFSNGFAGYSSIENADNVNTTQNSNTDIWLTPAEYNSYTENSILVVTGKIYVASSGDYRLALRGRYKCAFFYSLDGGRNYLLGGQITNSGQYNGWWDGSGSVEDPATYTDFIGLNAGQWIYFKEVLLLTKVSYTPFIGLGWGAIEKYASEIEDDGGNTGYEETVSCTLSYAAGYRASYEFPETEFVSDYLFTKRLSYTYDGSEYRDDNRGTLISSNEFTAWSDDYGIGNLFDDDDSNDIHSAKGADYDISSDNPFEVTVDLGGEMLANRVTIYGRARSPYEKYLPKTFTLYGGTSLDDMHPVATQDDAVLSGYNLVINFNATNIRYYRLCVTATYLEDSNPAGTRYICFRFIQVDYVFIIPDGRLIAPDDRIISYYGDWEVKNANSDFGRIYEGVSGSVAEFTFVGTRFCIRSFSPECAFDVYIDGEFVASVDLNDGEGVVEAYLSETLGVGEHTVKIEGEGAFNIASVALWQD